MALVTMEAALKVASATKTAIPAYSVDNMEIVEEIASVAEKYNNYPAMLMIGQNVFKYGNFDVMVDICKSVANSSSAPLVIHLDHGVSYEQAVKCLRAGFTSVMFDGSRLPLDENITVCKKVCEAARAQGASVEAELGAIGGVEDGQVGTANIVNVDDARRFISEVTVDALAIGIGNAHGIYKSTPNLAFDRLQEVEALGGPPLVLHGGSGIPDEMIKKAIYLGIRKINVATEVRMAFVEGLRQATAAGVTDIYKTISLGREKAREVIDMKTKLFCTPLEG